MQRAIKLSTAGDRIYLRQGRHARFRLSEYHKNPSGVATASAKWLVISSAPGEHATVDAAIPPTYDVGALAGAHPIRISGASYVIIENLEVTDSAVNRTHTCDPVTDTACPCDLNVESCQNRANNTGTGKGIQLDGPSIAGEKANAKSPNHHLIIRNCEIHGHGGTAIVGANASYNIEILNNEIHHNGVMGLSEGYATYLEGRNHVIRGNYAHHNSGNGFRLGNTNNQGHYHLVDSVVENNFAYANGSRFWHSGRIVNDGAGIVLWGGHGNTIRNNIVAGSKGAGFWICGQPNWNTSTNTWVDEPTKNPSPTIRATAMARKGCIFMALSLPGAKCRETPQSTTSSLTTLWWLLPRKNSIWVRELKLTTIFSA
ncbi:MAG: right-handed parallel beta-helix repeat-containing protein [Myxococcota bacterium]